MAYESNGNLPVERASKIGHIRIVEDPVVQELLQTWERADPGTEPDFGELSGTADLSQPSRIENIVAVDGSFAAIPNTLFEHKRMAFITVGTIVMQRTQLRRLEQEHIIDPRELQKIMSDTRHVEAAVLPLSGMTLPEYNLVQTLRIAIDRALRETRLLETLKYLLFRPWDPGYGMGEHFQCAECGQDIHLVKDLEDYTCGSCGASHTLADYLQLVHNAPTDWATEEVATSLANVLETLMIMFYLVTYRDRPVILERTLFIKDGPLLLRAQLSRLIEPIRSFLDYLRREGRVVHLLGVEKTGALVNHAPIIARHLKDLGDYFLPTVRYLHERIEGTPFDPTDYRNRVQYGSKLVIRLGPQHVVALNAPPFMQEPRIEDLGDIVESLATLSEMVSCAFENALSPLVMANAAVSISMSPSREILTRYAERVMG